MCWSRAHWRVCHRVAERRSRTGNPSVELGDGSHLNTLLLPSIIVQARLLSATSPLMLLPAVMTGTVPKLALGPIGLQGAFFHASAEIRPSSTAQPWPIRAEGTPPCVKLSKGPYLDSGPLGRLPAPALPAGFNMRGNQPFCHTAYSTAAPVSGLPAGRTPC